MAITFELVNGEKPASDDFTAWAPGWWYHSLGLPLKTGELPGGHRWILVGWFLGEEEPSVVIGRFLKSGDVETLFNTDGQFILILYYEHDRSLEIYRDRTGTFPLVYVNGNNGMTVSVNIDKAKQISNIKSSPSTSVFEQWPLYRKTFSPMTPFDGIYGLAAENSLLIKGSTVTENRHPMFFNDGKKFSNLNTSSQVLGDILSYSVQKRIDTSKRLGILLSGGNDSSLTVALVRKYYHGVIKTLFVTFEDNPRDYGYYAQQVAGRFTTEHYSATLSPSDYVGVWANTIKVLQTPVPMPCHIGVHYALKMLSGDVDLMIDGDGADTVFGSSIWPEMILLSRINRFIPTYLKDGIEKLVQSLPINEVIERIAIMIKTAFNSSLHEYPHVDAAMISEGEFNQVFLRGDWQQAVKFRQGFARGDFYKGLFSYLMLHELPEDLATTVRLGLSQGILFAYPFLDYGLLQASMRLPNKYRYHYRIRKAPLKKYSLNYFDREFIYKPKEGFGVPLSSWFTKKEFAPFLMLPLEERSIKRGWWKELELKRILELHRKGEGNDRSAEAIPWIVINMELWARICVDGDSPSLYK